MEGCMVNKAMLRLRIVKKKCHLLQISKQDFYRNFFDDDRYERLFAKGGEIVVLLDDNKVIAFREREAYYEVDDYNAVL